MSDTQKILSVTEVTDAIRSLLREEPSLIGIAVRGELSNYSRSAQGHCYFTLKDETSSLRCVLFRGDAERLDLDLEGGQKIVAFGDIDVYRASGAYQLIVREVKLEGVGELHQKFLQLKKLLESEGLFAEEHKKPLPSFPTRIGVVTSAKGAAFRDILNVLGRRYPLADVVLAPSLVQGIDAPEHIVSAVRALNEYGAIDVMIVGRGGGSYEELSCFNDESVARAIFESRIPVVSAVGHETDFTIADFVADTRAATPSAAAELVAPDISELQTVLETFRENLTWCLENLFDTRRRDMMRLQSDLSVDVVLDQIRAQSQNLDDRLLQMQRALMSVLSLRRENLDKLRGMLMTADPLATLDRGYSIALRLPERSVIETVGSVGPDDNVLVMVGDGEIRCVVRDLREVERRPRK